MQKIWNNKSCNNTQRYKKDVKQHSNRQDNIIEQMTTEHNIRRNEKKEKNITQHNITQCNITNENAT